jgi:hypothetical protein
MCIFMFISVLYIIAFLVNIFRLLAKSATNIRIFFKICKKKKKLKTKN